MSEIIKAVSMDEFLMGRDKEWPLSWELAQYARETLTRVNLLLNQFGQYRKVTSGYRPEAINKTIKNAAPHSNHMICRACDLYDPKGDLDRWCVEHQDYLEGIGLWLESPTDTKGWCHVQTVAPLSRHRIFIA